MLQHAIEERLLGIYEELADRLRTPEDRRAPDLLRQAAALVRQLYEDFHQRLEEQYVFPHFENHAQLGPLVKTLRAQHAAGRQATDGIVQALGAAGDHAAHGARPPTAAVRSSLARACRATVRLHRPHMAREATDLFQTLYDVLPSATLDELAEQFEKKQEKVFGEDGFKNLLAQIAGIEKELGLYELKVPA
ncbi:MAG: hemerythrin domain-containing protein [Thermoguttaceae bacterium]|jgi:type II secretory pathway component PulM